MKSIQFQLSISGFGIVNFDSKEQKYLFKSLRGASEKDSRYENVTYAKGRYYKAEDGTLEKTIIISADCIRNAIFKDSMPEHMPNIMHDNSMLISTIATPAMMERGYMFAKEETWKRTSPLKITSAKATKQSVPMVELFTKTCKKESDEKSDNSLFRREVQGDIEYICTGVIDLAELGFISLSDNHDRFSFNPDFVKQFSDKLSQKIGAIPAPGYYKKVDDIYEVPEYGIKLTENQVVFLASDILKRLVRFNIQRTTSGYAKTSSLKIRTISDPIDDLNKDWTVVFDGATLTIPELNGICSPYTAAEKVEYGEATSEPKDSAVVASSRIAVAPGKTVKKAKK